MTREEMITKIVEHEVEQGKVNPELKNIMINARLNGMGSLCSKMSQEQCELWYKLTFEK